jgi:hypothetical protein
MKMKKEKGTMKDKISTIKAGFQKGRINREDSEDILQEIKLEAYQYFKSCNYPIPDNFDKLVDSLAGEFYPASRMSVNKLTVKYHDNPTKLRILHAARRVYRKVNRGSSFGVDSRTKGERGERAVGDGRLIYMNPEEINRILENNFENINAIENELIENIDKKEGTKKMQVVINAQIYEEFKNLCELKKVNMSLMVEGILKRFLIKKDNKI